MLERIYIRQFAIIDELAIDFAAPFTVLTGETGAGKSIIIDAVAILLGGRAQNEMIRFGASKAYVEGVFSLTPQQEILADLLDQGYLQQADESLVLSRELCQTGKNTCRINGRTLTLSQYRQIALGLVDIHGQHDYQQMMQTQRQLGILDAYGGRKLQAIRQALEQIYQQWQSLAAKVADAGKKQQALLAKKDFLQFQLEEIQQAKLQPGEEAALSEEIRRLGHGERIMKNLQIAYGQLFGTEDNPSCYDLLGTALNYLRDSGKYDATLIGIHDRLEPAIFLLDEAAREIGQYQENMDISPKRLEEAENRLYRIRNLCKKYGSTVDQVLAYGQEVTQQLAEMETLENLEADWSQEISTLSQKYETLAMELQRLRREASLKLEKSVDQELKELAMTAAHFKVAIQTKEPGLTGRDSLEFLISSNAGEPFLPLAKIASGGELSRITLAMKRILAAMDCSETMIFDEIDSGIGGKTAHAVAEKLAAISQSQQVICVTHSAAIAARANQHLLLEKQEKAGRTQTGVKELNSEERVEELARMLGGDSHSPELLAHAQSLLNREA